VVLLPGLSWALPWVHGHDAVAQWHAGRILSCAGQKHPACAFSLTGVDPFAGETCVVSRGVEHKPFAAAEVSAALSLAAC
jgi:hypothetical protein